MTEKWLDVINELPDEGTWVIGSTYIITSSGEIRFISKELFFDSVDNGVIYWLSEGDWDNEVTHWMYLPTPYQNTDNEYI